MEIEQTKSDKSTSSQAYFNFIKTVIGIGITAIPYTSEQAGQLWAVPLMILVMYCCYQQCREISRSTVFLLDVADSIAEPGMQYHQVVQRTLKGYWPQIFDGTIIINQLTLCVAYLIFVTQFVSIEFQDAGITTSWAFLVPLIPILPLTLVNNVHFFHQTSAIGMLLGLVGISITMIYGWIMILDWNDPIQFSNPVVVMGSFQFIGVGIFCFEGITTVLPIRDSMIDRFQFRSVFSKSMYTTFFIVLIVQQSLTLTYGSSISSILVFSIPDPKWQCAATGCYCISILLTYPLQLYPATEIIENIFIQDTEVNRLTLWINDRRQLAIRLIITVFIFATALVIPNFAAFLNILGSVFGTLLQYVIPCLMHISYFRETLSPKDYGAYFVIITFSGITLALGMYQSLSSMFN